MKQSEGFASPHQESPRTYYAYIGAVVGVVVAITVLNRIRLGDRGWMFTWQLVGIAAVTFLFAFNAILQSSGGWQRLANMARSLIGEHARDGGHPRRGTFWWIAALAIAVSDLRLSIRIFAGPTDAVGTNTVTWPRVTAWVESSLYFCAAAGLMIADHRTFVVVIAVLQAALLATIRGVTTWGSRLQLALLSIASWALLSGVTYTHLADWLMNGAGSSALAVVAFVAAFYLVLTELGADSSGSPDGRKTKICFAAGLLLFAAYALRTDNLLSSWVPLHRSYFSDIAQSVKDGHWLLWDVPSLYGFLSILTLALIPSNGWESLYVLTAFVLVAQACMTFAMLRWGNGSWRNGIFAVLLPVATLLGDSISRYPWSARLYPQGGLRFFWIVVLLFIAFLMFVWRDHTRRIELLRWGGHIAWLAAVLWSVDNALWATILWVPYVVLEAITCPVLARSATDTVRRLVSRAWPLLALPVAAIAVIDVIYRAALGRYPDWLSYIEFTGPFAKGAIRLIFHVQDLGAGWTILVVLGAVGATMLAAILRRRWDVLPLLGAAWFAVWGTATYFALEPLDMYISLLLAVLVPAATIVIFVSRTALATDVTTLFSRLSIAPLAIIAIALLLGEPSRIAAMQWHMDVVQDFPPLSGELAALIDRVGITPNDRVLVQNGRYWTELQQGMILPFTRTSNGVVVEYHSWLPISPVGPQELIEGLPESRQHQYINRYLARSKKGGWYITYRQPARCESLSNSLRTNRTYASTNFSASLCEYTGRIGKGNR